MRGGRPQATRMQSFLTNAQVTGPWGVRRSHSPPPPTAGAQGFSGAGSRRSPPPGSPEQRCRCVLQSGTFLGTQLGQVHRREASHQGRRCEQLAASVSYTENLS